MLSVVTRPDTGRTGHIIRIFRENPAIHNDSESAGGASSWRWQRKELPYDVVDSRGKPVAGNLRLK